MTPGRSAPTILIAVHLGLSGVGGLGAQTTTDAMSGPPLATLETPAGPQAYRLHAPEQWHEPRALLVVLHGCLQTPDDIARGTGFDALADEGGFAVVYPEQPSVRNPQRCWNWFDAGQQTPDGPEPARLLALVDHLTTELGVDADHTWLSGISAGGAMAAVLAAVRPERFAGVAVHSGVPYGAATGVTDALAVMQGLGPPPPDAASTSFDAARSAARPRWVLVIHGGTDPVVSPDNGRAVAAQWVGVMQARAEASGGPALGPPEETRLEEAGRRVAVRRWTTPGPSAPVVEHRVVVNLGHAWSGGDPSGTYTDPAGPSASRWIVRFFGLER